MRSLRVALAQLDVCVGDIDGNTERILDAWRRAHDLGADLVVTTELAITGYPPEDLLLKPEFVRANLDALDRLTTEGPDGTAVVVGYVGAEQRHDPPDSWDVTVSARDLHNSAALLTNGEIIGTYNKWRLPNYGVFDEARYFHADDDRLVAEIAEVPVGVTVCEDLWVEHGPVSEAAAGGAKVVCSLNASPYHRGKRDDRERWVRHHATTHDIHLLYVNCVGGQDEVVFDGDSMVATPDGDVVARGAQFDEDLVVVDLAVEVDDEEERSGQRAVAPRVAGFPGSRPDLEPHRAPERFGEVAEVWQALRLGLRDYCHKNGFETAVLGLSGGIDSALTAALAADALGADKVTGVGMPSPYSSDHSLRDAEELTKNLGITWRQIPIEPGMEAFDTMLAETFEGTEPDITEENIQARIRGMLLMALSNKFGSIVLATGNKSEMAVGYSTLYGDMAGGFAVLKDVPKLLVYDLARWHNEHGPGRHGGVIPWNSIEKAPSAELKPGQTDQDTLPPYEVLDDIIAGYVEEDLGVDEIVARGHDRTVVRGVVNRIDRAEFKRRQAPPGVKITDRAFGRDRRVPITSAWRG
ncbi:MAG: NAD+ synthase [Nitriliruptorales bacterium]|nr:NAD+ synthase [Nitriliruptorales bacterium]